MDLCGFVFIYRYGNIGKPLLRTHSYGTEVTNIDAELTKTNKHWPA